MTTPSPVRFPVSAPAVLRNRPELITWVLVFVGAHLVLGLITSQYRSVASLHAVVVAIAAIAIAFTSPRVDRIVTIAGYCAVSDVYWRMNKAVMPWEGAKYLTVLVLLIAYFRFVRHPKHVQAPVLYFALLMPGAAWSLVVLGPQIARDQISANLAGPALLCVGAMLLRQLIGTDQELSTILWAMVGPVVAVATIATRATVTSSVELKFTDNSNFITTGGFGPNQVSTILGLGALVCILLCLSKSSPLLLLIQIGLAGWFTAQAALTFSRGGLYSLAVGCIAIVIAALSTRGVRSRVVTGLLIGALVVVALYPSLNAFTGGALENRFSDTSSSGRDDLTSADLELFRSAPLFGLGVGVAKYERINTETAFAVEAKAHTEYTRLLAEHGVLGLVAAGLLILMAAQGIRRSTTRWNRLLAAGCAAWALITMAHIATGIAAISFVFALSQIRMVRSPHPL